MRTEEKFSELHRKAEEKLEVFPPPAKRFKSSEKELMNFKALYFEIIDNISTQIESRFEDYSQLIFFSLVDSSKFSQFQKSFPNQLVSMVTDRYPDRFDNYRLINELGVIYNDSQFHSMKFTKLLKTFVENDFSDIFPEAFRLFVLIATIPATTVGVEQNFSCLKRIKNYLRNSMSQSRLSSLAVMSIEKELLVQLYKSEDFLDKTINKFLLFKDRRINLIYKK